MQMESKLTEHQKIVTVSYKPWVRLFELHLYKAGILPILSLFQSHSSLAIKAPGASHIYIHLFANSPLSKGLESINSPQKKNAKIREDIDAMDLC